MNILKSALMATLLFSAAAGAVGLPTSTAPDFSKWASKTLKDAGVNDARVVETKYPFNFTFCRKGSPSLWRYDVMSIEQLNALQQGKTVKPLTEAERTVEVEPSSESCKAASWGQQAAAKSGKAKNCTTTGPNSPVVTGENSVVVINGKTYAPGQSADCGPASTNVSTHGSGSPIVTGAGSKVTIRVDQ